MIEFENWHRLEDLLDELQAELARYEAVVKAARKYVKFSPKSGRTSMDNAWMDLVEVLEQADE